VVYLLKYNRFWFFALGGVLVICLIVVELLSQVTASQANIYLDGARVNSFDLSGVAEPYSVTVESAADGRAGMNVLMLEHGRIRVSEADCPDGFCVRQGWLSSGAVPIVCLPHRLVIRLEGGSPPEVDAVVG
jgi:hypothetical protein